LEHKALLGAGWEFSKGTSHPNLQHPIEGEQKVKLFAPFWPIRIPVSETKKPKICYKKNGFFLDKLKKHVSSAINQEKKTKQKIELPAS